MPRYSRLARSTAIRDACLTASVNLPDFLVPALYPTKSPVSDSTHSTSSVDSTRRSRDERHYVSSYAVIAAVVHCATDQPIRLHDALDQDQCLRSRSSRRRALLGTVRCANGSKGKIDVRNVHFQAQIKDGEVRLSTDGPVMHNTAYDDTSTSNTIRSNEFLDTGGQKRRSDATAFRYRRPPPDFFSSQHEKQFAEASHLPLDFYRDISNFRKIRPKQDSQRLVVNSVTTAADTSGQLEERLKLLRSVRDLEDKLAKTKQKLSAFARSAKSRPEDAPMEDNVSDPREAHFTLTKDDYKNLVDLYYYSHNSRFSPESSDLSPTPSFLDDFSFKLSEDFSLNKEEVNENETYESPLRGVERMLVSGKLREIAVMQVFVDLLLDDESSNRALYEAYKNLPHPGVSYLPGGVIRLFLQRMSTPWTNSEKSMLRYLALIDDMQAAKLPITKSEWSSAVYLAGRSFARVTEPDVAASFNVWQRMENGAGVKSSHVTFNILFDIAVRAGKFALGQTILMEMSKRNLRLNRLGRVSLIYYHGLRGDGDGVRKTYHDFVESGEIVDTLVLNCVIAALLNAQESTAAEQVYERMKNMHLRRQKLRESDDSEEPFTRYPSPGTGQIGQEMASNHLGRILSRSPNLRELLPDHHKALQASMPLTPDSKTFSTMIAYHATKSGDLDRLSALLNEMIDLFELPLHTLTFQLLFKGFALHGPSGGPDSAWSVKRLNICWDACRQAVKNADSSVPSSRTTNSYTTEDETPDDLWLLPSMTQINNIPTNEPLPPFDPPLHNPPQRRLSSWHEFVLDLAAFPRERLRRIERFHSQMFDDENAKLPHESRGIHTFKNPFFQSTIYTSPEPALDHEEGEYVLPNPAETSLLQPNTSQDPEPSQDILDPSSPSPQSPHPDIHPPQPSDHHTNSPRSTVSLTRPLICWLLRAYARNTRSRSKVEEIWGSVRKLWRPRDTVERESVVRVLRRCLRDCDRESGLG